MLKRHLLNRIIHHRHNPKAQQNYLPMLQDRLLRHHLNQYLLEGNQDIVVLDSQSIHRHLYRRHLSQKFHLHPYPVKIHYRNPQHLHYQVLHRYRYHHLESHIVHHHHNQQECYYYHQDLYHSHSLVDPTIHHHQNQECRRLLSLCNSYLHHHMFPSSSC